MNDSVVAIVGAFFIIGITMGIIAVVALSALRADRRGNPPGPMGYGPGLDEQPTDPSWDDAGPDGHPRWPGEVDNHFRNG
jgi:hypothetical protein